MDARTKPAVSGVVGKALPHDSAHLHVSGRAAYTDDLPEPRDLLHLAVGMSTRARARLGSVDLGAVLSANGVVDVLQAADIPGVNNCGPIVHDEQILATDKVEYAGQAIFAVAADSVDESVIERIRDGLSVADIDERDAVLIEFGRELFGDNTVSTATYARALAQFGQTDLVDLIESMAQHARDAIVLIAFQQQLPAGQQALLPLR